MIGRYSVFVVLISGVVALSLGAWRLSAFVEAKEQIDEATSDAGGLVDPSASPIEQAQAVALQARLVQAAQAGNVYFAQSGTFAGLSADAMRALDPALDPTVVVAWSTPTDYCVQVSEGTTSAHLQASRGSPETGPCPT
jgi:hypothetical protein